MHTRPRRVSRGSCGGGGGATTIAPGDVAGLEAWYKFDDATTLTLSGSDITAVADKTANSHDLVAGDVAPTTGTMNGKVAASFDGTQALVRAASFVWGLGPSTILVAASASASGCLVGEGRSSTTTPYYFAANGTTIWYAGGRGDAGGAAWDTSGGAWPLTDVVGYIELGTDYGVSEANDVRGGGGYTRPTTTLNQFSLGCLPRTTEGNHYTGEIGEVLIIDGILDNGTLAGLIAYLEGQWL